MFTLFLVLYKLYLGLGTRARKSVINEILSSSNTPLINTAIRVIGTGKKMAASRSKCFHVPCDGRKTIEIGIDFINCRARAFMLGTSREGNSRRILHLRPSTATLSRIIIATAQAPGTLGSTPIMAHLVATGSVGVTSTAGVRSLLARRVPNLRFNCTVGRRASLGVGNFNKGTILFLMSNRQLTNRAVSGMSCDELGLSGIKHVRVIGNTTSTLCNTDTMTKIVGVVSHRGDRP